jgi:hypothetical protein
MLFGGNNNRIIMEYLKFCIITLVANMNFKFETIYRYVNGGHKYKIELHNLYMIEIFVIYHSIILTL